MQNLGKADKTTDEIFEEHLQNFNQQTANSTRLHKDINNYIRCIRGRYQIKKVIKQKLFYVYTTFLRSRKQCLFILSFNSTTHHKMYLQISIALKYVIIVLIFSAMQTASKNLQETLGEVYEGEWPGHDQLYVQGQNSEMLWADLAHKLSDQVLIPLNTYQGQFPEMRVRYNIT